MMSLNTYGRGSRANAELPYFKLLHQPYLASGPGHRSAYLSCIVVFNALNNIIGLRRRWNVYTRVEQVMGVLTLLKARLVGVWSQGHGRKDPLRR